MRLPLLRPRIPAVPGGHEFDEGRPEIHAATLPARSSPGLRATIARLLMALLIALLLTFLFFPLLSIFISMPPAELIAKLSTPLAYQALLLSLKTTVVALLVILLFGTPLAYRAAKGSFPGQHFLDVGLQIPIVTPPAVAGIGLLLLFGNGDLLGRALQAFGLFIPFTVVAVVMAQIFIAAPFYIVTARQAFEAVDDELLAVSRTLGDSPRRSFLRITLPLALPGLLTGAALGWARALGEFGATIMFAGNLPGKTRTLPLAIYTAMQSSLPTSVAMSALLLIVAFLLLLIVSALTRRSRAALVS